MALTPEDVINKRFQPTKFREGYDQDEVDDFLDEIVVELRRLNQENADLREQLEGSAQTGAPVAEQSSAAETSAAGTAAAGTSAAAESAAAPAAQEPVEAETATAEPAAAAAQPEERTQDSASTATDDYTGPAQNAAGVLAMAQKLHDQYVSEGRDERDRLIAEGRAQADTLVSEAEGTKSEVLSSLEEERRGLESAVSDLRTFESSYRERLAEFIGGQLEEIKAAPSLAPDTASTDSSAPRS